MTNQLLVSVIIPVYNGRVYLLKCLEALKVSIYHNYEIIVVDDASIDDIYSVVETDERVNALRLEERSGPAAARNLGAVHARGDILLFIDSDVIVRSDSISLVVDNFKRYPEISAVFGSYDDDPVEKNFISQYRNLFHHYHHQQSNAEAVTFWAGCGAIRKEIFKKIGGFNQERYTKPCIEDIELGHRLHENGHCIRLDNRLLVKHLKKWDFMQVIKTDIFQRAIPWSQLILNTKYMPNVLNLKLSHKISSILIALMFLIMPISCFAPNNFSGFSLLIFVCFDALILVSLIILNIKLYAFFFRKRGFVFVIRAIPLHFLYYFYSSVSFVLCFIKYKISLCL
ncbi:MAG: glycosyltransferase family 2 protein [Candidatus Anammoxibacter sp.]